MTVEDGLIPDVSSIDTSAYSDNYFNYSFSHFEPSIEEALDDTTYKLIYDKTDRLYTINFVVEGKLISSKQYKYNEYIEKPTETPIKASTVEYNYNFEKWIDSNGEEPTKCLTDNTYSAVFNPSLRVYTISWNVNGSIIDEQYYYGETPRYKGNLAKADTPMYKYTFKSFEPAISKVTKDQTYLAQYDESVKTYGITFYDENGSIIKTVSYEYGQKIDLPEYSHLLSIKEGQIFDGWVDEKGEPVSENSLSIYESLKVRPKLIDVNDITDVIVDELVNYKSNDNIDSIKDKDDKVNYYHAYRINKDKSISDNNTGASIVIDKPVNCKNVKYHAYLEKEDGSLEAIDTNVVNDKLELNVTSLGNIVVVSEIDSVDLSNAISISSAVVAGLLGLVLIFSIRSSAKKKSIKSLLF